MSNKQLWITAVAGFIGLGAPVKVQARSVLPTHDGTVHFVVTFAPEGLLVIRGKAAEAIWNNMRAVPAIPAVPDLESRKPADVSLDHLERKHGADIQCYKIPAYDKQQGEFRRDPDGKLITDISCELKIKNVTTGQVK